MTTIENQIIRGNKHKEQTRDGDAYSFQFTMYVNGQEYPHVGRIDQRHTKDAFVEARARILEHENEIGPVPIAWLTRRDITSDASPEQVFEYYKGTWTLN